ncbi:MAG: hypothetical protein Q8P11_04265 [bacterium]|nr:hypothetical protein [bacterium]
MKPIIPIGVSSGKNSLRYGVLIDSGADFSIFDGEIGDALGIDVRSGVRHVFGGIQNVKESEAFRHVVIIEVGGLKYETEVSFSYDIAPHGHGILGKKGFFQSFCCLF